MYNEYRDSDQTDRISQGAKNTAKRTGKAVGRGIKRGAKGIVHKIEKEASKDGAKIMVKVLVKLLCKKTLIIIGVILFGILLLAALFMAAADFVANERGTTGGFTQTPQQENVIVRDEEGVYKAIAFTQPQAMKTAYYRLMSCGSYVKFVPDISSGKTNHFVFYDPQEDNKDNSEKMRQDFGGLQDYFEHEKNFLLSPDYITMADEKLHNELVFYPEQIIKPVYHTEDETGYEDRVIVKTELFCDEDSTELKDDVTSKGFDEIPEFEGQGIYKKKPNNTDVQGIWDYGMGSVMSYQTEVKDIWHTYHIDGKDVCITDYDEDGNVIGHHVEYQEVNVDKVLKNCIPLKGKDIEIGMRQFDNDNLNDLFGNSTNVYPINIPVINSAALFSGSIEYEYDIEETITPFSDGIGQLETDATNKYYLGDCDGTPMYEYRSNGQVHTKMPVMKNEQKDVLGFDYLDEYHENYKNYIPLGLKNDIDFKKRVKEKNELLIDLGLLKPYIGDIGTVIQGPADIGAISGANGQMNDAGNPNFRSWSQLTMMAHLIAAEAANNKLDELLVGAVVVNRMKANNQDIYSVISAGNGQQYACFDEATGGAWARSTVTASDLESAKQVLTGEFALPSNVYFQSQNPALGAPFMQNLPHHYMFGWGQTTASPTDSFGRPSLTPQQLRALASQLDGAGSMADYTDSAGNGKTDLSIGGSQTVEVTYYCSQCNSPVGDSIAWADGPTKGKAKVGETCAMSKGSMAKLGVKYGDWINISGVGNRRVEDLCGAGFGGTTKTDRIVIDVYVDPGEDGNCACSSKMGNTSAKASKVNGQESTQSVGYYSQTNGLYYTEIANPHNFELFDASPFDTFSATNSFQKLVDPDLKWYEKLADDAKNLLDSALDLVKGIFSSVFEDFSVFDTNRFYVNPTSSPDQVRESVYQAITLTSKMLYEDVVEQFDENNMDLIFVGNSMFGSPFGGGFGLVNGVGTTVEGFVSPTDTYYQAILPYSTSNSKVTLGTPDGTDVQAVFSGEVTDIGDNCVTIDHKDKEGHIYTIRYGNIDLAISDETKFVSKEQLLGTSRAGGLEITVTVDGETKDPMSIFYQPTFGYDSTGLVQFALAEFQANGGYPASHYGRRYKEYYNAKNNSGYGDGTHWCGIFVGYCADNIGLCDADLYPWGASPGCIAVRDWFKDRNAYIDASTGYIPKPGDVILFDWSDNTFNDVEHIGIVEGCDGSVVYTIEGNTSDPISGESSCLARKERTFGGPDIAGYCIIGGLTAP